MTREMEEMRNRDSNLAMEVGELKRVLRKVRILDKVFTDNLRLQRE